MKILRSTLLLTGLFACSSPCEKAYDAASLCYEEAGADMTTPNAEDACEEDDGSNDEIFECMAEVYTSGDCTTDDGLLDAALSAAECSGTLNFDSGE